MIVFDTETTGLVNLEAADLSAQPHIIEFAGIKLDDQTLEEQERLSLLLDPGFSISEEITKITGLTTLDLEGQPSFAEEFATIAEFFLGERTMVAHNLAFDKDLLRFELMRIGRELSFPWPYNQLCTVEASYGIKNHRLSLTALHKHAFGTEFKGAHRAMNDVEALVSCIKWLRNEGMM